MSIGMGIGIEQLFRSMAGADWMSQTGGLSASEFAAALKERAGADLEFAKGELRALGKSLGLDGGDSRAIFDFLEKNGHVSVDALRDKLLGAAGADKAFNLDEFKGGIDKLLGQAHDAKADGANFRKDAGADKAIDKNEFEALAKKAGITDQEVIDKAFDKLAGADGKINREEFKDGLGDTKLSKDELAKKIKELGGEEQKKDVNFNRAAGADKALDEDEFKALAKKAGIKDEDQIKKVFDQVAGADGEISKDEFKAAFGDTKLSGEDFKKKFDELAKCADEKKSGCDETDSAPEPEQGQCAQPDKSDEADCSKPEKKPCSDDTWSHEVKDGKATIRLGDKYTITAEENGAKVTIQNNETGAKTVISGDPHFDKKGDGKNDFDFKKDMTLALDDGTKVTIGTVDAGNGTTLTSSLTITNGDKSIQVTGLGGNNDGANNLKVVQSDAGETVDDLTSDGVITLLESGTDWLTRQGQSVTQAIINEAEAA